MDKLFKTLAPGRKHKTMLEGQPPTYLNQQPQEFNYINHQQHSTCGFQNMVQPLQPNLAYQHQIYPQQAAHQHQPMQTMTMSPVSCGCQPNVMQVQPQHSVPNYQIQTHSAQQMRNDTLDTSAAIARNEQAIANVAPQSGPMQHNQPQNFGSVPSYQTVTNNQTATANGQHMQQSSRYCDNNSYYSNQPSYMMSPQQPLTNQSSQQPQQSRNGNGNTNQQYDERFKLQQQQQQQQQQRQIQQDQHHPQQQQNQQHLQNQQQQAHNMDVDKHKNGWQPIYQQQQQYQNHDEIADVTGDDLPLEASCLMHERDHEELLKMASVLRSDMRKLADELNIIRKVTPEYSVSELKI
jgi:hypothetical protein